MSLDYQRGSGAGAGSASDGGGGGASPGKQTLSEHAYAGAGPIQRKEAGGGGVAGGPGGGAPTSGGAPLPDALRTKMERAFHADFSDVRIHEGDHVQKVGALAYAQGHDLHFAPGQYRPDSPEGQALIGHELAHVVQQGQGRVSAPVQGKGAPIVADASLEAEADRAGAAAARGESAHLGGHAPGGAAMPKMANAPIQRFESLEHQSLGDTATGSAQYDVGAGGNDHFNLSHGDLVALSGDYFLAGPNTNSNGGKGATDDIFALAAKPGNRGQMVGTRDEILWVLQMFHPNDPRFAKGGPWAGYLFSDAVKAAVDERYQRLATQNTPHFAAPRGRDANGKPNPSPEGAAGTTYRSTHEAALRLAFQAGQKGEPIARAMAMEAAAQHYLTDAFSAGHLRTPVGDMRQYWGEKYPLFWYNLRHKMALDTAVKMNDQTTNVTTIVGTVNQMYAGISKQIEAMTGTLPAVTLGDLLAKVFHDHDNATGVDVGGGNKVYGDDHLDDKDPANKARPMAQGAIQDGDADIQKAYALGQAAKGGAAVPDDQVFAQVRTATQTGDSYLAETRMPTPAATEGQQNWKAGSLEELWTKPITGKIGPTVGSKIIEAMQPGHDIRDTLDGIADKFPEVDKHMSGDLRPRQAFKDGFLAKLIADPRGGLLGIINWAPNYGLASNSRDDQSLASGQELDNGKQLGGMTTPARISYIKELLDGYTASDEGALILRIFQTAPAGERKGMYKTIEGHDWDGSLHHGLFTWNDRLYNGLTSAQRTDLKKSIDGG